MCLLRSSAWPQRGEVCVEARSCGKSDQGPANFASFFTSAASGANHTTFQRFKAANMSSENACLATHTMKQHLTNIQPSRNMRKLTVVAHNARHDLGVFAICGIILPSSSTDTRPATLSATWNHIERSGEEEEQTFQIQLLSQSSQVLSGL